jgi:hypothetical protein
MHVDSSVYITIAQGIIRGQIPYLDMIDNKGPLLYLFSVPGLYLGGFTGIWITELIFIFIAVLFAYKTALFFGDKNNAVLGTVFGFIALLAFFTVNAGTEEYSLPFLTVSSYIFVKYYFLPDNKINFFELIILGVSFASAIMIRINMFPLWAGFCFVIFAETVIKRRFILLLKYITGFCIGTLIVLIPILMYLNTNNAFEAFKDQVIFGGAARGFSGILEGGIKEFVNNFYMVINRNLSIIPLLFGLFCIITKYRKPGVVFYIGFTFSYLLMVIFLSFSWGSSHYNMVLIPFFIPAITCITGVLYSAFSGVKLKNIAIVLLLCASFSEGILRYFYDLSKILHNDSGVKLINAGKMIDENTKDCDTILSINSAYIFPFTHRMPVSKYIFGIREETVNDIIYKKPAVDALFTGDGYNEKYKENTWYPHVFELIEKDYRILSDKNNFILYIRKD